MHQPTPRTSASARRSETPSFRPLLATIRRNATPPEQVAAAVERQLTRRRMRPRSLVGADARIILGMRAVLPARGLDAAWARKIGV